MQQPGSGRHQLCTCRSGGSIPAQLPTAVCMAAARGVSTCIVEADWCEGPLRVCLPGAGFADLQTEGSEAKKELAPEYVANQKSVDSALLGSLSDDLKVRSLILPVAPDLPVVL